MTMARVFFIGFMSFLVPLGVKWFSFYVQNHTIQILNPLHTTLEIIADGLVVVWIDEF